jgi:hypothetical protein
VSTRDPSGPTWSVRQAGTRYAWSEKYGAAKAEAALAVAKVAKRSHAEGSQFLEKLAGLLVDE